MENQGIFNLNNQIYTNNNNLLSDAVNKLEKLIQLTNDNILTPRIKDIINIMKKVINNTEQLRKDI